MTEASIKIISYSENVENLLARYKDDMGADYESYRGHVYQTITYAMHFLDNDETLQPLIEAVFVYHDIGLWTDDELAYLEPSEEVALKDNQELELGLDPDLLKAAIHWHHKVTPYNGTNARIIEAVRKADWIAATGGKLRKGLSKAQVQAVISAIPDHGFADVLQRLAKDLGGSAIKGNLKVLKTVFKV